MGIPFRWSPTKHIPRDINTVNALLRNESWQKVMVYRDPMERFLSAFNSKCLLGDGDGRSHCHEPLGVEHPTIPAVADRLANGPLVCDPHWRPMARFCGGTVGSAWEQYTHHVFLHHLDARQRPSRATSLSASRSGDLDVVMVTAEEAFVAGGQDAGAVACTLH